MAPPTAYLKRYGTGKWRDTYDLSNYTTDLAIDLNPGASSIISTEQLAYLGDGHYAAGNVYNAYLFNGDARSIYRQRHWWFGQ